MSRENLKILFVENHEAFSRITIRQFLSDFDVLLVPSLAVARAELKNRRFDLVLVDYDLDDGKGAELLSDIREINPSPKVIAVSSHDMGNQTILNAGADAICEKMNFETIGEVIAACLDSP